ncbi:MAG: prepilin-type N-terminal cleavage/methylation domain-containing protein [bacterium]|nr:prepilin-type N-terminal cleavage/methylation domain-containing protein [bacterium]
MTNYKLSKNLGFSIVELLVVIAIIGLLASVAFVQIEKARAKARDAQREKNVKVIQDAMAIYVAGAQNYPLGENVVLTGTDAVSQAIINRDAISKIPQDPINSGNYRYFYNSVDGSSYVIIYYLETDTISGKNIGVNTAAP